MFFSGLPRLISFKSFPNLVKLIIVNQALERIEGLESCVNLQELWITECKLKVRVDQQMFLLENVDLSMKTKGEKIFVPPEEHVKSSKEIRKGTSTIKKEKKKEEQSKCTIKYFFFQERST